MENKLGIFSNIHWCNSIVRSAISLILLSFLFLQNLSATTLKLNEVSVANTTYLDELGNAGAWIELYNESNSTINLNDFYISDSWSDIKKFRLPSIQLEANNFIIVFVDGKNRNSPVIHANFSLLESGEPLILSTNSAIIDHIAIPTLENSISYGRQFDGNGNWGYSSSPTPAQSNSVSVYSNCMLNEPEINLPSGTYSSPIQVAISHSDSTATIHYTLDGTEPTNASSVYQGPLTIEPIDFPNRLSLVPTNPAMQFPMEGGYTEERANARGWLPPYENVSNINVLKVKCVKDGCVSSPLVSHTYILGQSIDFPLISIILDSLSLFDYEKGIYHYGSGPIPNYDFEGMEYERPVLLQYFNAEGVLEFSEPIGIRIGGNGSRHSTQKNLKLYFRDQYGRKNLEHKIFADENLDVFETLLLRSGGHRPDCLPKDEIGTVLTKALKFDKASYVYARVYINGEYWGIHSLKQHMNEEHVKNKYNIDMDDIVLLNGKDDVNHGTPQDGHDYQHIVDYVSTQDLNLESNYSYVHERIDLENYRDYMISQIFLGNADWPFTNIKFWRKRTSYKPFQSYGHDGKYRWMMFDLDGSFGGSCTDIYVTFNALKHTTSTEPFFEEYTRLFRGLLSSQKFKTDFINRTCDLLNSTFKTSVTIPKFRNTKAILDPHMLEQVTRWRYPSIAETLESRQYEIPNLTKWNYLTDRMENFLLLRPSYCRMHIMNLWGVPDTSQITIDVNNNTMGEVKINSLVLRDGLEGASAAVYPWSGIYFHDIPVVLTVCPKPGYRFVEWAATGSVEDTLIVMLTSDTAFTAVFELDTTYEPLLPLVINEVMPSNSSVIKDEFDEYDDWLEVYNPNAVEVNLDKFSLTDDKNKPAKHTIDMPLTIPAYGFTLFWCDDQSGQGVHHTNFKLKNSNREFVGIYNEQTQRFDDSVMYNLTPQNVSYGRVTDGSSQWRLFSNSSPGRSNNVVTSVVSGRYPDARVTIFPNPTFSRSLRFSRSISGAVHDFTGNELMRFENAESINLPALSPGIYYIKSSEGGSHKFVLF